MKLTAAQKETLECVRDGGVDRFNSSYSPRFYVLGYTRRSVVVERLLDVGLVTYNGQGSKVTLTVLGRNALASERAANGGK